MPDLKVNINTSLNGAGLNDARKGIDDLGQSAGKAGRDVRGLADEVNGLSASQAEAARSGQDMAGATDSAAAATKDFGTVSNDAATVTSGLADAVTIAGGRMGLFGARLLRMGTAAAPFLALIAGVVAGVKALKEGMRVQEMEKDLEGYERLVKILGKDTPEAAKAYTEALKGNEEPLKKLGLTLEEVRGKASKFTSEWENFKEVSSDSIGTFTKSITEAEPVRLALEFWTEQLEKLNDGLESVSSGATTARSRMDDLEESAKKAAEATDQLKEAGDELSDGLNAEVEALKGKEREQLNAIRNNKAEAISVLELKRARGELSDEQFETQKIGIERSSRSQETAVREGTIQAEIAARQGHNARLGQGARDAFNEFTGARDQLRIVQRLNQIDREMQNLRDTADYMDRRGYETEQSSWVFENGKYVRKQTSTGRLNSKMEALKNERDRVAGLLPDGTPLDEQILGQRVKVAGQRLNAANETTSAAGAGTAGRVSDLQTDLSISRANTTSGNVVSSNAVLQAQAVAEAEKQKVWLQKNLDIQKQINELYEAGFREQSIAIQRLRAQTRNARE